MYRLRYSDRVKTRDIPRLDPSIRDMLGDAIRRKLEVAPDAFGKPLQHALRLFRVLRISDWRVIYQIRGEEVVVVAVRHRREGYADLT